MNIESAVNILVFAIAVCGLFGDEIKAVVKVLVATLKFVYQALAGRTPKALEEPETDEDDYTIDPALAVQVDLLEKVCQVGEYAPGKPKYECQHEWINGVCFWCDAHEQPHRPRKFARNATPAELAEAMKPTDPASTLEAILAEPDPEPTKKQVAMDVATKFVHLGQVRAVKNVLDDLGVRRVVDLQEDQIEPFIRGLANQDFQKRY